MLAGFGLLDVGLKVVLGLNGIGFVVACGGLGVVGTRLDSGLHWDMAANVDMASPMVLGVLFR